MVCSKCAKLSKPTTLATPTVKRKSELYHGSLNSSSSSSKPNTASTSNSSGGGAGISKNKLLSKGAKNPYAAYAASCEKCKTKVEQGRALCQRCAYKGNACAMCGKAMSKDKAGTGVGAGTGTGTTPVVVAERFSSK